METGNEPFRAYASKKQALVVLASILPMIAVMAWVLVLNAGFPIAVRGLYAVMLLIFALILLAPLRALTIAGPTLRFDTAGVTWHGWSDAPIPWSDIERWAVKRHIGATYISLWLKNPDDHAATTFARWTQAFNPWLGFGHIAIPTGGLNRNPQALTAAFSARAALVRR